MLGLTWQPSVLSLTWQPSDDTLSFNLNFSRVTEEIIDGHRTPTKKVAFMAVMSLLDPLGLSSPITIQDSNNGVDRLRSVTRFFKQFIAERVTKIEEETAVSEKRWTPNPHNVADNMTRDVPCDFNRHHRWFTGSAVLLEEPK
ncbi:hypothetical protein EVAR_87097_1 [Eumeta japonica]|uniref:Uncharacterized protein n=1 Tax=Eumeta variegata TaxID=151549 RepID=A0A4C1VSP1_EUMVA|nr:hypothetical protein EVAR_87097_1 [Eumeta japonica]